MALTKVSRGLLSTSIEDNGNATAITIDSSENVGIGTSTTVRKLTVNETGTSAIAHFESDQSASKVYFHDANTSQTYSVALGSVGDDMAFYASSGGNERMRIDSSGNVQVKGGNELRVYRADNAIYGSIKYLTGSGGLQLNDKNGDGISFVQADGATEYARIDSSGNLLVGVTSIADATSRTYGNAFSGGSAYANWTSWGSGTHANAAFRNGTNQVGSIVTTSTSTAYNTSSDYRLKENIADADDAGSKIDAIQVRKYDWKADGSHQDYGMIAQELQTVAPEAVSGDADSEEMMGVDYSKLVPMLIKEIQSLRNRVTQLEE